MKKIRVEVKQEHIARGVCDDAKACPIALAARESGIDRASVGTRLFLFFEESARHMLYLPPEAIQFVQDFDSGKPVTPFAFELEVGE